MDINIRIEQIRDICDHFVDQMESKLDEIGITLSPSDIMEISDTILKIVESDIVNCG
ncbi:MAG: hypothetical protein L3I99_05815 [Sulfurimonas sp.]|nr:hypothetical protein [Sulfurimonas sp.]